MLGCTSLGGKMSLARGSFTPFMPAGSVHKHPRSAHLLVVKATGEDQQPKAESVGSSDKKQRRRRRKKPAKEADTLFSLEDLNPVTMGRKSREVFDDVWTQLQRIGSPRSAALDELPFELTAPGEFESPKALDTTVLVVGATGRVGRVLVRKLLLRNYKVRALIRQRNEGTESIPQSVELVYGDIGDYKACREAVKGADKVICCSAARTTSPADLIRVEEEGVANMARAFQDEKNAAARKEQQIASSAKIDVADFKDERYHEVWDVEHVGIPADEAAEKKSIYSQTRAAMRRRQARDSAETYIDESDNLVFEGAVYSRGGYAELGGDVSALPHKSSLAGTEGLLMRLKGDAHNYTLILETESGATYYNKFSTQARWSTLRLPYNTFLPSRPDIDPVPNPAAINHIRVKFEPKVKMAEAVTEPGQSMFDSEDNRFRLELDWIKALPGGEETDFVLVSCAGAPPPGMEPSIWDRVVASKRKGESNLRNSGLGYTVVRPGPLAEEAGGYKALVFDQGNRISQGIACADVADVCLKALHDGLARNKTFEVCWEYTPEAGLETYELVAHLPDKANNYLSPALATLQKNT